MSFYQDRQIRGYLRFVLVLMGLLLGGSLWMGYHGTASVQALRVTHDAAIASALLDQGLSPNAVVAALDSQTITESGRRLFALIGRDQWIRSGPSIRVERWCGWSEWGLWAIVWGGLLLGGTAVFLEKRRALYQQSDQILRCYIVGDFSQRLPQNQEGAIYHLFAYMEQFATLLAAQSQDEHQTKEFLKDMISDISHQLKTPLAALMMYQEILTGVLADEPGDVDTLRVFTAKMGSALQRMEQLILSLLKSARLDSGNIVFEPHRYDVTEVIAHAVDPLITRASAEGKTIQIGDSGDPGGPGGPGSPTDVTGDGSSIRDATPSLVCDRVWTAEAIGNIVKNALDHTRPGDSVRITWERSPTMLRLVIADNGSGIAPEDIHHIFKRFYRSRYRPHTDAHPPGAGTASGNPPGVGLGLSLAKAIVEGQGGILSVQSRLGQGTIFTLSFRADVSRPADG